MKETAVSTTTLNMENFEKTVTGDGITLVDFWAEWCGPCKMFGPIFEQTSEENPDVTFAKVDTEAEQQLAGALGIMSIPTLMIFRDGIQLFSQAGALPKSALDDLLRQVRELDMDEIRRQVENHDGHDHDGHDHDGHDHDGHDHPVTTPPPLTPPGSNPPPQTTRSASPTDRGPTGGWRRDERRHPPVADSGPPTMARR
jgi:thioredoxin